MAKPDSRASRAGIISIRWRVPSLYAICGGPAAMIFRGAGGCRAPFTPASELNMRPHVRPGQPSGPVARSTGAARQSRQGLRRKAGSEYKGLLRIGFGASDRGAILLRYSRMRSGDRERNLPAQLCPAERLLPGLARTWGALVLNRLRKTGLQIAGSSVPPFAESETNRLLN